jgi:hypothetical protein
MQRKFPFDEEIEDYMLLFFDSLNEKDRRHYLALEAKKLGHGGIKYLSELFEVSEQMIRRGLEDLGKKK